MNGFPIIRVLGILLGGISLVLLSQPAFGIQFPDAFKAVLDVLGDSLSRFFAPLEYWVVVPVIEWLRSFNLNIPHPAPHWHHTFVLLWLLNGSLARNISHGEGRSFFLFLFIWGGGTAFVAGVATGIMPLSSWAIFYLPMAGIFTFSAGFVAVRGAYSASALATAIAAFLVYFSYLATEPMTSTFGPVVPSPGLLGLAGLVVAVGLLFGILGLNEAVRDGEPIDNPGTSVGLDIVGAFGIATTIAAIGFSVPSS